MRRRDRLGYEADFAKARELRGGPEPPGRALLRALVTDEADGPAERDRVGRGSGELLRAVPDVDQDQRDQLLEPLRVPEHVRPRLEGIAEERLERLKEPARRVPIGVDVRLDDRVIGIG